MKKTVFKMYYFVLMAGVLSAAAFTIVVGSSQVAYGRRIATLESQQKTNFEQKQVLQQQIAAETSVTQLAQTAQDQGFVPMAKPIHVHSDIVASRL